MLKWVRYFNHWPRALTVAVGLCLVGAIGWVEYWTATKVSLVVIYLIPISFCTLAANRVCGIVAATASAVTWLTSELLAGVVHPHSLAPYWNTLTLWVSYMAGVFLLSALRESLERLEEMVEKRTAALNATELQLIQAEKLESLGRMAVGVAHEVKNPLMTLMMGVDYLTQLPRVSGQEETPGVLKDMRDAVERGSSVINEVLSFARPGGLHLEPGDVNAVLEQSLGLLKHDLVKGKVNVIKEFHEDLPPAQMDVNKIEQVFLNALTNAIHAMPEGGTITVRTFLSSPSRFMRGWGESGWPDTTPEKAVITVEIEDTGIGIAPDDLSKVFDPFFTTKPPGKGSGLGLSVVRQIVEMHQGTVELSNRDGGGARFTVNLNAKRTEPLCHINGS
jgi:signal transduction histidine kinase